MRAGRSRRSGCSGGSGVSWRAGDTYWPLLAFLTLWPWWAFHSCGAGGSYWPFGADWPWIALRPLGAGGEFNCTDLTIDVMLVRRLVGEQRIASKIERSGQSPAGQREIER